MLQLAGSALCSGAHSYIECVRIHTPPGTKTGHGREGWRRNPPGPRNLPAPRLDKAGCGSAKLGAKGGKRDAVGQHSEDAGILAGVLAAEGLELVLRPLVVLVRVQ